MYIYTHTLRVLPIHFGRETVPSGLNAEERAGDVAIWLWPVQFSKSLFSIINLSALTSRNRIEKMRYLSFNIYSDNNMNYTIKLYRY